MPWCPICKNEYVEGVSTCADCGCSLVDSLDEIENEPVASGSDEALLQKLLLFLQRNNISSARLDPSDEEGVYYLFVDAKERKEAVKAVPVFYRMIAKEEAQGENPAASEEEAEVLFEEGTEMSGQEAADQTEYSWEDRIEGMPQYGRMLRSPEDEKTYEEASKKAEEYKSGAWTLLVIGILGLVVMGVLISGVLPIRLNPRSQMMTCLVMAALFIIFIVMGVQSFRSYKNLLQKAKQEASWKEKLEAYKKENLNAAQIDEAALDGSEDSDEVRYFKRISYLREKICSAFPDLEDGYVDHYLDENYPLIFGDSVQDIPE